MKVYDRLKEELKLALLEELKNYPIITKQVIEELKEKEYYIDISYGSYSHLVDIAICKLKYKYINTSFSDFIK